MVTFSSSISSTKVSISPIGSIRMFEPFDMTAISRFLPPSWTTSSRALMAWGVDVMTV
jgi:hypothetical protein